MKTLVIQKSVVLNNNKLLALRRSETDVRRPLEWDLPGGRLDEGESLMEGLHREIKEEAGLTVEGGRLVYSKTEVRPYKDKKGNDVDKRGNCVFLFYLTEAESTEVTLSSEHKEFAWMTFDEAIENFNYELHKEALTYIQDNNLLEV